jgi:3-hydroxy-9,10-secoandrosta-1,3,5(10)-triene-9,17-dione monooxygenase reductase component
MPVDPADFRATLSQFASGVTVLTSRDAEGRDVGMTATAFSSLSLDPPLVLFCVGHEASMAPALRAATHVAVHVLAADQEQLSRRFAAKDEDRFAGLTPVRGVGDVPLLEGAAARLECRIAERLPRGDHVIVVAEVLRVSVSDGTPLLYYRGRYGRLAP